MENFELLKKFREKFREVRFFGHSFVIPDSVNIGYGCTISYGLQAGENCHIGAGTYIDDEVALGDGVSIAQNCILKYMSSVGGASIIGNRCFLGEKSTLWVGAVIGDDCEIPENIKGVMGAIDAGDDITFIYCKQVVLDKDGNQILDADGELTYEHNYFAFCPMLYTPNSKVGIFIIPTKEQLDRAMSSNDSEAKSIYINSLLQSLPLDNIKSLMALAGKFLKDNKSELGVYNG